MSLKSKKEIDWIGFAIVILAFMVYVFLSMRIPSELAPDELMRLQIVDFIKINNSLPKGDELSILNPVYGFSYGFFPYLTSITGFFTFKFFNLFTNNGQVLLLGLRFASVLSGVGTVIMCLKIGKQLFEKRSITHLFAVLCGFLPQFVFLSSYLNNDSFSIFTTSLIVYFWIRGLKSNWNYKVCMGLGIAIGLCFLSYYNAYGFILCSVLLYSASFFQLNGFNWKLFIKKGLVVFFFAFAIAGWYFIRAYIIYDGDILGFEALRRTAEIYAIDAYKPSQRISVAETQSLYEMLFQGIAGYPWVKLAIKSFIGVFGNMNIAMGSLVYAFYLAFLGFGGSIASISLFKKFKEIKRTEWIFLINLLLCIVIPIILSVFYSYYRDYQPQGRYFMSILIPFMLIVAFGLSQTSTYLSKVFKWVKVDFNYLFLGGYIVFFGYVFIKYLLAIV